MVAAAERRSYPGSSSLPAPGDPMPFGQPIEIPTVTLDCGCVAMGRSEADRTIVKHCPAHWAELPADERTRIQRERRASLLDGLYGIALRLAMIGVAAFMVWYVWRGLTR